MSVLVPMSKESFVEYINKVVVDYAIQNVVSGRWTRDEAVERSRAEHVAQLPLGLATPNHYLFEIHDGDGMRVGSLWFGITEHAGARLAFVFDVSVEEQFRRRGHAKRAFEALETLVRSMGLSTIALHVFAFNTGAQALYRSLGYDLTSVNMQKRLADESAPGKDAV